MKHSIRKWPSKGTEVVYFLSYVYDIDRTQTITSDIGWAAGEPQDLVETVAVTKLNADGLKKRNMKLMALREDLIKLGDRLEKSISDVENQIVVGLSVLHSK